MPLFQPAEIVEADWILEDVHFRVDTTRVRRHVEALRQMVIGKAASPFVLGAVSVPVLVTP
ncbi:MAG: hypothetical protein O2868_10595 [Proteobacteria bacterium]|jgi:hypothetical protein|nr:hypothetical protein [Pseudomonadota bacterium]